MIESFGSRPAVLSGPAASLTAAQAGEKVVHRPQTKVLPLEPVDKSAPTGPKPTFKHTYLELAAALWPDEPEPPATVVQREAPASEARTVPENGSADEGVATLRDQDATRMPTVDIRR